MEYDYIFSGFGLAAMLLLDELIDTGLADAKKILIIEKYEIPTEKTWCYWENSTGKYDSILEHSWRKGFFTDEKKSTECLGGRFIYKCISSEKLREYIDKKIERFPLIVRQNDELVSLFDDGNSVSVVTTSGTFQADFVFNSVVPKIPTDDSRNPLLLQHFEGWFVKSKQLPFTADAITIMDFSVKQMSQTRFMYVLPFSNSEALVEFTLFSPELLREDEYEIEIRRYLSQKGISDFEIAKKETGVIPMTTYPFHKHNSKNVLNIGTAGGWTKASTGYTFVHALKNVKKVASELKTANPNFSRFHKTNRFTFYDRIFNHVLFYNNELGKQIFSRLFTKTDPVSVLRFLNEESTILEELKIILACPKKPFLKSFFKTLF
ncbi:MAG: lycopene cyclase [Flavobacterium sp.]|uniref:lycopene cyclase family protein n=1 Tax=Flavobacterium sp. TaxID=239 RepID=UPI0012020DC9|nr:lycopene cyclase family protein [Flavobacterium sp.]RZJ66250.1 MAG: lycopene cyclase [Flavobacterium sp.]